jgi:hypothetical protein
VVLWFLLYRLFPSIQQQYATHAIMSNPLQPVLPFNNLFLTGGTPMLTSPNLIYYSLT